VTRTDTMARENPHCKRRADDAGALGKSMPKPLCRRQVHA
jgi:hypothetical protein